MRDCKQETDEGPIEIVVRRPTAPELRDAVSRVTNAALERIANLTRELDGEATRRAHAESETIRMREALDRCAARDIARSLALGELLGRFDGLVFKQTAPVKPVPVVGVFRNCQCGLCLPRQDRG